jgi:hypothetical protein
MISPFFTSGQTVSAHGLYLAFVALILFLAPGLVRLVLPSPATLDWWTRLLALPLLNLGILCEGHAGDADPVIAHLGEIGQPQPTRRGLLPFEG